MEEPTSADALIFVLVCIVFGTLTHRLLINLRVPYTAALLVRQRHIIGHCNYMAALIIFTNCSLDVLHDRSLRVE